MKRKISVKRTYYFCWIGSWISLIIGCFIVMLFYDRNLSDQKLWILGGGFIFILTIFVSMHVHSLFYYRIFIGKKKIKIHTTLCPQYSPMRWNRYVEINKGDIEKYEEKGGSLRIYLLNGLRYYIPMKYYEEEDIQLLRDFLS